MRNVKARASSKGGSNGHVDSATVEQKGHGEGAESTNGEGNGRGPIYVEDGDRPPPGLAAAARQQSESQLPVEPEGGVFPSLPNARQGSLYLQLESVLLFENQD